MQTRRQQELEILDAFPPAQRWMGDSEDDYERGVLLSDKIEDYVARYKIIQPFDPEKLKPAAYELSVGTNYAMNGEIKTLDPHGMVPVEIEPFGVVIVQTLERLNMPNFLIGRWNIRVTWAYQGLFWVGAPQVDPGYRGFLFCPLYNLSDRPVVIRYGEAIAQIDFVTTTLPIQGRSKPYPRPEERTRLLIEDYNPQLKSALVVHATKRLNDVDETVQLMRRKADRTEDRLDTAMATVFTALGILFAVIVVFNGTRPQIDPYLFWVGMIAAGSFAVTALFTYYAIKNGEWERLSPRKVARKTFLGIAALFLLSIGISLAIARLNMSGTRSELSVLRANATSQQSTIRLLSCQLHALAAKHSVSTCR